MVDRYSQCMYIVVADLNQYQHHLVLLGSGWSWHLLTDDWQPGLVQLGAISGNLGSQAAAGCGWNHYLWYHQQCHSLYVASWWFQEDESTGTMELVISPCDPTVLLAMISILS